MVISPLKMNEVEITVTTTTLSASSLARRRGVVALQSLLAIRLKPLDGASRPSEMEGGVTSDLLGYDGAGL